MPIIDERGDVVGYRGADTDITERKRAEEMLKADLAFHREDLSVLVQRQSLAVKISSFGIWDWDPKENSMTWDNKLFEIYGIEKKSPMPYEDWVHLIHPDDLPTVETLMRTVIETRSEAFLDYRIVRPDGELRHINAAGTVVLNDAGEVVKVIGINQDITERKLLEAQLQQAATTAERERLARELHDAVTQTLFSASVIAEATPKIWDEDEAMGRRYLEQLPIMLRGALAEMRMLLLELRPSAIGEQTLGQLLESLVDSTRSYSRAEVTLKVEGDRNFPNDITMGFLRIVQEGLNNVIKHAEASLVEIWLSSDPEGTEIHITDDGHGFDPESIPAGSMGINIMRDRARNMGAVIKIDSQPGTGSRVLIAWQYPDTPESKK